MAKIGEVNYDPERFMQRGLHEISNALYPESNIPLRDHAGLYGASEHRDVEPAQADREVQQAEPDQEQEMDEPELDL
jgi:hypothetical protein